LPQAGAPNGTVIEGYWPGNANVIAAGTSVVATVIMDPTVVYDVQVSTSFTAAMQYFNAQIVQPALGNTATGISGQSLATPATGNAAYPVKVLGLSNGGGGANVAGINYNNVYAVFNTPVWATNTAGV
jgi:hypothetical protein